MAEYEEAGYYELQLNNKQLVFFFMAAVAIAVVVFLCGVMVGRGVRDAAIAASGNNIVSEPGTTASAAKPTSGEVLRELDYSKRLESNRVEEKLEPASSSPEDLVTKKTTPPKTTEIKPSSTKTAVSKPAANKPAPKPTSTAKKATSGTLLGSAAGTFTIQVVALKTDDAAQKLVNRLKTKNYRAYLEPGGETGLFRVRVGRFQTRAEAEKVAKMLRDTEKFKPYITQ
jgi:cell division septation protein DedD